MLLINSKTNDPYFNIATEEYLLKNYNEDILYFYVNEPSIVVGKHQNTLSEINLDYVSKNGIKVIRRLSGGGTVFHDQGNLNFCFIKNTKDLENLSFKTFAAPIVKALNLLNIPAYFSSRNDILLNGKKISGNAVHVYKKRVLSHGTLLFDSDLSSLSEALKSKSHQFQDRAVKSVRSRVGRINVFYESKTFTEFRAALDQKVSNLIPNLSKHDLTPEEKISISDLAKTKYCKWEWNFGYSPRYTFKREILFNNELLNIQIKVEKGLIKEFIASGGGITLNQQNCLKLGLLGAKHEKNQIKVLLEELSIDQCEKELYTSLLEVLF